MLKKEYYFKVHPLHLVHIYTQAKAKKVALFQYSLKLNVCNVQAFIFTLYVLQ